MVTKGGWKKLVSAFSDPQTTQGQSDDGNVITKVTGWIVGGIKKVGGWLLSKAWELISKIATWSITTFVQWVQQSFNFLWNFDWNASDDALNASIDNQYKALTTQAAGAAGAALGWLVGGLAPGAVIMMFNEPLGVYLLNKVGQEALEEILPRIADLIRSTLRTWTRHGITGTYQTMRRLIVGSYEFLTHSDEQIDEEAQKAITNGKLSESEAKDWSASQKRIRDAAKNGGERKVWSFHKGFENWRKDNIPEWLQDASEEFVDEFSEAFWEGLLCLGGALDSYVAMQKETRASVLGNQTAVKITFDRSLDSTSNTPSTNPTT
ncbi:MAG TPA: hypothetical protein V6D11_14950 [Waterburya sp.]